MKKHYDEQECIKSIKRNKNITINTVSKTIQYSSIGIGNSTWGKIDCLCHYHGYTKFKKDNSKIEIDIINDKQEQREIKKESKFSLLKAVKSNIKKIFV